MTSLGVHRLTKLSVAVVRTRTLTSVKGEIFSLTLFGTLTVHWCTKVWTPSPNWFHVPFPMCWLYCRFLLVVWILAVGCGGWCTVAEWNNPSHQDDEHTHTHAHKKERRMCQVIAWNSSVQFYVTCSCKLQKHIAKNYYYVAICYTRRVFTQHFTGTISLYTKLWIKNIHQQHTNKNFYSHHHFGFITRKSESGGYPGQQNKRLLCFMSCITATGRWIYFTKMTNN